MLFINKDKVVSYDDSYLTDSDYEIKPGKTEMVEVKTSETFDSVLVFFVGYGT